jgi:hypothetical protein
MKENKIQNKTPFAILFVLLVFVLGSHAFAGTYYVDGSCGSSGNGTTATCGENGPWKTLAEAASGVPNYANHTINVAPGTYSGFTDSRSGSAPGYRHWLANGTVTITSYVQLSGSYIKFEGFTLDAGTTVETPLRVGQYVAGQIGNGDHIWALNNRVYRAKNNAVTVRGHDNILQGTNIDTPWYNADGIYAFGYNHLIKGNWYHNLVYANTHAYSAYHIDFLQTMTSTPPAADYLHDTIVEGNFIFMGEDSSGDLLECASDGAGTVYGFMLHGAQNITIRNNLIKAWGGFNTGGMGSAPIDVKFYNNTVITKIDFSGNYGGAGFTLHGASTAVVRNNIFCNFSYYNGRGASFLHKDTAATWTTSNNRFWNSDGDTPTFVSWPTLYTGLTAWQGAGYDANSSVGDPGFVANYSDLHLQGSSTAINKGYNLTGLVHDDYDGVSRPQGSAYDIGAYEYTTLTPIPKPPTGLKVIP